MAALQLTMAISNELSSEIAAAILGENKTPQELNELKNIVLEVHSTLQQMSEDDFRGRIDRISRITSSD